MKHYPIYLSLKGRTVLLVGAGRVALHKVQGLLESGAILRVVAPQARAEIEHFAREQFLKWSRRPYETADLDGVSLVIAATDNPAIQKRVAEEARARGLWVNLVDSAPHSDFIAPSVIMRGELQVAISTGGAAPALAKMLRQKLEPLIGPEYGQLVILLRPWRDDIAALSETKRTALWSFVGSSLFIDGLKTEGLEWAERTLKERMRGLNAV